MNTQQDRRWWFSVRFSPDGAVYVERFDTKEQAELHAAMVGGFVPLADYPNGFIDKKVKDLYEEYLALSERTE